MSEVKPYSRDEVLLDNIAKAIGGGNQTDIDPYTRNERLLKNIADAVQSGGSGLPPFTSADKGKFLGLGDADPVETEVVVIPEQNVVLTDDAQYAWVSNANFSNVSGGDTLTLKVDGHEETVTAIADYGGYDFVITTSYPVSGGTATVQIGYDDKIGCGFDYQFRRQGSDVSERVPGTYAVSLSAVQSVTPSVQTVIVPEQEVTITDHGDGEVAMYFGYLSNFDFSSLVDGNEAVFNINGVEYSGECLDDAVYFNVPDHGSYYVEDDGKFEWYESAVLTVSATASVAALEPEWRPFGGVYTLSSNAENTLLSLLQTAITTAATGGSARVDITTGFDSDDLAMIEKMADDFSSGSPCVLSISAITNALSPTASSTSDTIGNKFVTFNIPLYKTSNMYFNIIFTLNAGNNLFGTVTVIKLAIT